MKSFLAILVALIPFSAAAADTREPLRIGFIGALSGTASPYGIASKNGIELAREELAARTENLLIEIQYEDDGFDTKRTIAAYNKLRLTKSPALFFSVGSSPSNGLAPLAEKNKSFLFAWASDPKVSSNRQFVIRIYPSGIAEGEAIGREAKRRNLGKVGLFYGQNDYANSVIQGFRKIYPEGDIVSAEAVESNVEDFRALLARSRSRGANALFNCLDIPWSLVKQARALRYTGEIFGCETMNQTPPDAPSSDAIEGSWFATVPIAPSFREKYRNRFGNEEVISGAAVFYDLMMLIAENRAKQGDISALVESIVDSGPRRGAIDGFQYRRDSGDTFVDIEMVVNHHRDGKLVR